MTDKEFRRLKRIELIEIIYELQKSEEELKKEMEFLKSQLEEKEKRRSRESLIIQELQDLNRILLSVQSAVS